MFGDKRVKYAILSLVTVRSGNARNDAGVKSKTPVQLSYIQV